MTDGQDRAQVTSEMYHHWLQHPVTQRFRAELEEYRSNHMEQMADFNRSCDVGETGKMKGVIYGIDLALMWKVEAPLSKEEKTVSGY